MKSGLLAWILAMYCAISLPGDKTSLWKTYQDYFPVGAAINPEADLKSKEKRAFIAEQYNSITPENHMKPRRIHPAEFTYDWTQADFIVEFARKNSMLVRGHTLVWHQSTPEWMVKNGNQSATSLQLLKRMRDHIQTVMHRYKNDVYCWDVVNEAISDNPNEIFRNNDPLYKIIGADYVEHAFRFAREADPNALLFYNDYRFSNPLKRKKIYELLKSLKARGVPIDGVGFQSHYVPGEITESYLQETIDMFSALGLKIHVTELDVSVHNYRNKNAKEDTSAAYTSEKIKEQVATYRMLFDVYRRNSDKISSVTFWGISDSRQNFRTNRIGKMDYPFLFDELLQPKPPYYAITDFVNQ